MYERLWRVVGGQLLATAFLVLLMIITIIGIPFGVYFYIAWQFVQQEIMFEDRSIRDVVAAAATHSCAATGGGRSVVTALLALIGVVTGPVLGFFLIFLNFSPILVNLIGSVVFALLIPYVAIGRTLLYFDLGAREAGRGGGRR